MDISVSCTQYIFTINRFILYNYVPILLKLLKDVFDGWHWRSGFGLFLDHFQAYNNAKYLFIFYYIINILNSCLTQGRVEGWGAMKPRYCRSVNSKGAGRPRLTHHSQGLMEWNEIDETRVEKWWNEICGRGKREKLREKRTQIPFRPPRNPHGGTETRTRDPSATRPPLLYYIINN